MVHGLEVASRLARYFDWNSSHLRDGSVTGPVGLYPWHKKISKAFTIAGSSPLISSGRMGYSPIFLKH